MLAEYQAHSFLEHCERAVGRKLDRLRSDLASARKLGPLWELVTLYAASRVTTVDHEPSDATPDVLVDPSGPDRMWIEARHAESRTGKASNELADFASWIHSQIQDAGVQASDWSLRIEGVSDDVDPVVADQHHWKHVLRSPEWLEFIKALKSNIARPLVLNQDVFRCVIEASYSPNPHGYWSSGFAVPIVVDRVKRHPIYAAIKKKAQQAKGWNLGSDPLVVCVGMTQESGLFDAKLYPGVGASEAVWAALHDTSKWPLIHQMNHVPRTEGKPHRVAGSRLISAVVLASIEDRPLGPLLGSERRAEVRVFRNDDAESPLSESQERLLASIPIQRIKFANDAAVPRAIANRANDRRAHAEGKSITMSEKRDGGLEVVIPEQDLTWILSGKMTPAEFFRSYNDQSIARILAEEPPIVAVELVPGDAERLEPDRVKIVFGPPRQRLY